MQSQIPTEARTVMAASGVEPIDRLIGGLERNACHLVYGGSETGKTTFSIQFTIEGLKRKERSVFITRSSAQEIVKRFSQLGYDAIRDIESGLLTLLEYTDDVVEQIKYLNDFDAVIKELEWLLNESKPQRLIFDPIGYLFAIQPGNEQRIGQFVNWLSGLRTVSLLVADERDGAAVIAGLKNACHNAFRLGTRSIGSQTVKVLFFDKVPSASRGLAEQPFIIDSAKGIISVAIQAPQTAPPPRPPQPAPAPAVGNVIKPAAPVPAITAPLPAPAPPPVVAAPVPQAPPPVAPSVVDRDGPRFTPRPPVPLAQPVAPKAPAPTVKVQETRPLHSPAPTASMATTTTVIPVAEVPAAAQVPSQAAPAAASAGPLSGVPTMKTQVKEPIARRKFSVLVIDDDPATCNLITRALKDDCEVTAVHDGPSGLARINSMPLDLIVLDVNLPIIDGFHVCQHIRKAQGQVPIIIITGTHLRAEDRLQSATAGGDFYLTKPFSVHELRLRVRQMIGRYRGVSEWIGMGAGADLKAEIEKSGPVPDEQVLSYAEFIKYVERQIETSKLVGMPFSIVSCRLPNSGVSTADENRVIEIMRFQMRERDVMTTDADRRPLVMLPDASSDGVQVFIRRVRQSILMDIGTEPLFQWRTYPADGETVEQLLVKPVAVNGIQATARPKLRPEADPQAAPQPQPEPVAEIPPARLAPPKPQPETVAAIPQTRPAPPRPQPEAVAEIQRAAAPEPQPEPVAETAPSVPMPAVARFEIKPEPQWQMTEDVDFDEEPIKIVDELVAQSNLAAQSNGERFEIPLVEQINESRPVERSSEKRAERTGEVNDEIGRSLASSLSAALGIRGQSWLSGNLKQTRRTVRAVDPRLSFISFLEGR